MNINKLLHSKHIEITINDKQIDKEFLRQFRKKHNLTQAALANILGVYTAAVQKWEYGINNICGAAARVVILLNNNPNLINQLYTVRRIEK